ncbi:hypothetical protein HOY80DRAFT_1003890 [Tuber brumale]|nr:hypothetical protein HOY80DRAFT_1003890 [Tuber brumale]
MVAFCPFCGENHIQVDCKLEMERVVEEERQLEKVEFAGSMDVVPLEIEEEVAVVVEKKIVVRLPVAVAESVAGAEVAKDVAMVEVAEKGNEVVVVAETAEEGRRVRENDEERRRRMVEEERDVVRKRMNVWRAAKVVVPNAPLGPWGIRGWSGSNSGYGSPGPSGFKSIVDGDGVEIVGAGLVPRLPMGIPTGPRSYASVAVGSERRFGFKGMRNLGSVKEEKMFGPDFGRRLVAYGSSSSGLEVGRNDCRGMGWYCRNLDGYLT